MTPEQRLAWWNEVRFGMFIHWGLYAVLAGEWKGKTQKGIGEWIMHDLKIPIEEYEKLAAQFNPVEFDAEAWAEVAHQAGMKYLVITAKHHDGFCMFDSPSNPYNIVNMTPFKRDPMKELAAACHKRGIRMCFYYSQDLDWHAPGGGGHWEETPEGKFLGYSRPAEDFQKYLDTIVKPNLRELLTNYGPIGLIWFDVPVTITKEQSQSLRDFVHDLQPACLVSGRVGHGVGDYGSLGDNEHPIGKLAGSWETPATLNDTWGFKTHDHNWKSVDQLIDLLVNCASKGVNYLLNVGPNAQGIIPKPSVDLLQEVGLWLKRNGQAIYGTQASPFMTDPHWGRVTSKANTIYLIVKKWSSQPISLHGLNNKVLGARIIGASNTAVPFEQRGDLLTFTLPAQAPEPTVSVIAVQLDGPASAQQRIYQDGSAAMTFNTALAQIKGNLKVHHSRGVEDWTDTSRGVSWTFCARTSGEYDVRAVMRVNRNNPENFGNHELLVSVGNQSIRGTAGVRDMTSPDESKVFQRVTSTIGRMPIDAGTHRLDVTASRLDPTAKLGLRLMEIELIPVSS